VLFAKSVHPGAPVDVETIFRAVVAASASRDARRTCVRFYRNDVLVAQPAAYLPRRADRSFHGWRSRLESRCTDYAMVFNRLERFMGDDVRRVRDGIAEIVEHVVYPVRGSDITLFAGRYRRTPFGVHADRELNLYWPLIGPKTMRFWPPESDAIWDRKTRDERKHYQDRLSSSVALKSKRGDLMAWPGRWWHVGEARTFNVSLAIPLYFYDPQGASYGARMRPVIDALLEFAALQSSTTLVRASTLTDSSVRKPDVIGEAARLLPKLITRKDLALALTAKWLRMMSTAGLDYTLARSDPAALPFDHGTVIQAPRPVLWARASSTRLCIASDGNVFSVRAARPLARSLELINTLKPIRYEELNALFRSTATRSEGETALRNLLARLHRIGAIQMTPCASTCRAPNM